jgi:hypothetical protein
MLYTTKHPDLSPARPTVPLSICSIAQTVVPSLKDDGYHRDQLLAQQYESNDVITWQERSCYPTFICQGENSSMQTSSTRCVFFCSSKVLAGPWERMRLQPIGLRDQEGTYSASTIMKVIIWLHPYRTQIKEEFMNFWNLSNQTVWGQKMQRISNERNTLFDFAKGQRENKYSSPIVSVCQIKLRKFNILHRIKSVPELWQTLTDLRVDI